MSKGTVLKPANRAAKLYTSGSDFQAAPRQQHQFVIVFNLYPDVADDFLTPQQNFLKEFKDRLHFICHTVDAPNFSVVQDVINQYNRKRVINRKVEFDPLTVRMFDTHDGLGIKFIKLLYEFEFDSARLYKRKSASSSGLHHETDNYTQSILQPSEMFSRTHNFGLREFEGNSHRILKSIDLYQLAGKIYTKTRIVHPRLSRMDMDTFDYSSSQAVNLAMGFVYENLLFEEVNVEFEEAGYDLQSMMSETADFEDFVPAPPTTTKSPKITKEEVGYGDGKVDPKLAEAVNSREGSQQASLGSATTIGDGISGSQIVQGVSNVKNNIVTGVKDAGKSVGKFLNFGKN